MPWPYLIEGHSNCGAIRGTGNRVTGMSRRTSTLGCRSSPTRSWPHRGPCSRYTARLSCTCEFSNSPSEPCSGVFDRLVAGSRSRCGSEHTACGPLYLTNQSFRKKPSKNRRNCQPARTDSGPVSRANHPESVYASDQNASRRSITGSASGNLTIMPARSPILFNELPDNQTLPSITRKRSCTAGGSPRILICGLFKSLKVVAADLLELRSCFDGRPTKVGFFETCCRTEDTNMYSATASSVTKR